MSNEQELLTENIDGIFTITMNRPETMNSITAQQGRVMGQAIAHAAEDPTVRVVVITGAGRGFCSGGNFKGFGAPDPDDPMAVKHHQHPLWNEIEMKTHRFRRDFRGPYLLHTMGKPTIAMVNGAAVGAGVGLAASCDFVVASEAASFTPGYMRVGISPDFGSSYYVTTRIGPVKAREFYLIGDKMEAREAERIGLVNRVVPHERLLEETTALARKLAGGPPVAMHYTKECINAAESEHIDRVLDLEARNFSRCFQTADSQEAVKAFIEKRAPKFQGR